jgi:hypothetical protein
MRGRAREQKRSKSGKNNENEVREQQNKEATKM